MTAEPVRRFDDVGAPPVTPGRGTAAARRAAATRPRAAEVTRGEVSRSGVAQASVSRESSRVVEAPTRREPARPRRTERSAPARRPAEIPAPRRASVRRGARPASPPVPVSAARTPFVLLVLGIVAAGIVGLLVLNTAINTTSFSLQRLQNKQAALDTQEQQLKRDLADRNSPGSLEAAATRMGLVRAGASAFIRLPDGTVIGVPEPAPAATDPGAR